MSTRLLAITLLLYLVAPAQSQNGWIERSGIPVPHCYSTAFAIGNYGYVGTGMADGSSDNDFWRYDPVTDTWAEIDSMPTIGRRGAFSFSIGNKGYVGGGITIQGLSDYEFWELDPELGQWNVKAHLPSNLIYSVESIVGFSIGSVGYVLASYNNPNFYMFNPEINSWSQKATFPGIHSLDQVAFSIGQKGYVGSGFGSGSYRKEFWEYDPAEDKWTQKADVPGLPRSDAVGFSVGNYGYVGLGQNRINFLFDFWEYHPVTDSWVQIDSCVYATWYALGLGIGSKGYMGTGIPFSEGSGWWEYDPGISAVEKVNQTKEIRIYPNPTRGLLFISTNEQIAPTYTIFSILGQAEQKGRVKSGTISVSDLPAGTYYVKIQLPDRSKTLKFVKE